MSGVNHSGAGSAGVRPETSLALIFTVLTAPVAPACNECRPRTG